MMMMIMIKTMLMMMMMMMMIRASHLPRRIKHHRKDTDEGDNISMTYHLQ